MGITPPHVRKVITKLIDGRIVEYDEGKLTDGGIITEAFHLTNNFSDTDLILWTRSHKNIKYQSFDVGAVLVGSRLIDETELNYCLSENDKSYQDDVSSTGIS